MIQKMKLNIVTFNQSEIDRSSAEYMAIAVSKRKAWQEQRIDDLIGQFESIGAQDYSTSEEKIYVIEPCCIPSSNVFARWMQSQKANLN
jgi:hypothetical protein